MTTYSDGGLFEGILDAARKEAAANLEKARGSVASIEADNQQKIRSALEREKASHDSHLRLIQGRYDSQLKACRRRLALKQHGAIYAEVMSRVEKDLRNLPARPDYSMLLEKWIVEGIVGLGLNEVVVSCGEGDPVDQALLDRCCEQALRKTGRKFKASLGCRDLVERGVIVSSVDQRVSFNNLVSARLRRFKAEINDIVEGASCRIE